MTVPSAKIVADSVSPDGVRLTTFENVMHRFVLAEFNTPRVFSRNSASSRAIPVAKQIKRVEEDCAYPLVWPAEQKGMQGGEEISAHNPGIPWGRAAKAAVMHAKTLASMGVHKSVTNRLLEPFMWHTVVVTATAWENFFEQRCSPLAQPEIRAVAEAMREAYEASTPVSLREGEWHLPYVDDEDREAVRKGVTYLDGDPGKAQVTDILLPRISSARCARTSYLTHDGKRDIEADLGLYERLVTANPKHWSPLEHPATPCAANRQSEPLVVYTGEDEGYQIKTDHLPRVGNLLGWLSLRTEVEAEHGEKTFR